MVLLTAPSGWIRRRLLSGLAITIPLMVTIIVLVFVANFVFQFVSPGVDTLGEMLGVGMNLPGVVRNLIGLGLIVAVVFLVGVVAETRYGGTFERAFDRGMSAIPGLGAVYTSFNEMSDLLLSNDTQSFQEVKLVEFPTQGSYTLAFVTAETPDAFAAATDHDEMTTLFMPMAPNPVMGGFVMHVSAERVYDVDVSVEEGIQSIVTSGVAMSASEAEIAGSDIGEFERVDRPSPEPSPDTADDAEV